VLVFSTLSSRPLRTSWLIVGMSGLDLLPALGRALDVVLVCVLCSCGWCSVPDPGRPAPSGPRGRACRRSQDRPTNRTDLLAPRDSAPPPTGRRTDREACAPRTGAGPGHPGHA